MLELVINRGVPGSGKSTYAKAWVNLKAGRIRSNRDDIRFQTYGTYFGPPVDENIVTVIQHSGIEAALKAGISVIVDDCNIEPKYIRILSAIANKYDAKVRIQEHDVPVAVALERNRMRKDEGGRFVPEDVILKMDKRMKSIGKVEVPEFQTLVPYVPPMQGKRAILVDIDGTLAKMRGRSPFEWDRVDEDDIVEAVRDVVVKENAFDTWIIIMSGRDASCYDKTLRWLRKHHVPVDFLYMRAEGDMRKDSVVKYELFNKHIRDIYDVQYVLDDRNQVVDMWRKIGLTVFQVAEGNF